MLIEPVRKKSSLLIQIRLPWTWCSERHLRRTREQAALCKALAERAGLFISFCDCLVIAESYMDGVEGYGGGAADSRIWIG